MRAISADENCCAAEGVGSRPHATSSATISGRGVAALCFSISGTSASSRRRNGPRQTRTRTIGTRSEARVRLKGRWNFGGAQGRNRTTDTVIFSHVLYQLSYLGASLAESEDQGERGGYRGSFLPCPGTGLAAGSASHDGSSIGISGKGLLPPSGRGWGPKNYFEKLFVPQEPRLPRRVYPTLPRPPRRGIQSPRLSPPPPRGRGLFFSPPPAAKPPA